MTWLRRLLSLRSILIFTGCMMFSSCKHDAYVAPEGSGGTGGDGTTPTSVPCENGVIYFNKDVFPLINTTCAVTGCHDANSHKGGVVLTSYSLIKKRVVTGLPSESKLIEVVTASGGDLMPRPPVSPWTDTQIQMISDWISQGAKDNACDFCNPDEFKYATTIRPLIDRQCVGCHNSSNASGGVDLSTYTGLQTIAQNGKLEGTVKWATGFKPMPAAKKLSDCEIGQISAWVKAGSLNN